MKVRVIHLSGCDATPEAISLIKKVAQDLGTNIELEEIVISTPEEATKFRHLGSPTVQVNGIDIDPGARGLIQYSLA